jgi:hypothetical protein
VTKIPASEQSIDDFLIGLGWSSARSVDTEPLMAAWLGRGFGYSNPALSFVSKFDGISFDYPRRRLMGGVDKCQLDAVRAAGAISPSRVQEYEYWVPKI